MAESDQETANDIPGNGAPDELDSLIAEFDAATTKTIEASNSEAIGLATDAPQESADAEVNGRTLEDVISDAEVRARVEAANAYRASLKLDEKLNAIAQHEYKQALSETVNNVRGNLDKTQIRDDLVQAWLDTKVREDQALQQAWIGRAENPQMWKAAERNLKSLFHKDFSRQVIDVQATEDRMMVTAAIRGASAPAQAEPPPNYARMSDSDLRAEYQKLGIQPNF